MTEKPNGKMEDEVKAGEVPAETESETKAKPNASELTPEQEAALIAQYVTKTVAQHETLDAAKAEYDSEKGSLRQLYKQVKSELGEVGVRRVKRLVELERDENGEERLKEELEDIRWVIQHAEALPGQQLDLLADLRPNDDRAYAVGKWDGQRGKLNNIFGQGTTAFHRYQDGWRAGQDIVSQGFKPLEKPPADVGDAEPTHEVKA